ncbi:MAG: hypothetical protein LBJ09_03825 [Clostridiales bacterium]|jgi:hypothetical protein|nr:hypothetical protein [Clostridiales bacterium]
MSAVLHNEAYIYYKRKLGDSRELEELFAGLYLHTDEEEEIYKRLKSFKISFLLLLKTEANRLLTSDDPDLNFHRNLFRSCDIILDLIRMFLFNCKELAYFVSKDSNSYYDYSAKYHEIQESLELEISLKRIDIEQKQMEEKQRFESKRSSLSKEIILKKERLKTKLDEVKKDLDYLSTLEGNVSSYTKRRFEFLVRKHLIYLYEQGLFLPDFLNYVDEIFDLMKRKTSEYFLDRRFHLQNVNDSLVKHISELDIKILKLNEIEVYESLCEFEAKDFGPSTSLENIKEFNCQSFYLTLYDVFVLKTKLHISLEQRRRASLPDNPDDRVLELEILNHMRSLENLNQSCLPMFKYSIKQADTVL